LIWLTYVHGQIDGNQSPEVHIRSLQFDDAGYLYVGGHAYGHGLPELSSAGEYESESPYPNSWTPSGAFNYPADAFALRYTPGQELDWGTYFGGNATGFDMYSEVIYTLLPRNGGLYAGGVYTRASIASSTYYPLDQGGFNDPYFNDIHQGGRQGFLVDFCTEASVGVTEHPVPSNTLRATDATSRILVHGLSSGEHRLILYDALGRSIIVQTERNGKGEDAILKKPADLSSGMYILRADSKDLVKVWVGAR
jgi:hypothetical protein